MRRVPVLNDAPKPSLSDPSVRTVAEADVERVPDLYFGAQRDRDLSLSTSDPRDGDRVEAIEPAALYAV